MTPVYLSKLEADPHALTLIGSFDDEPFASFEGYGAKEYHIAPFYDAGNYDGVSICWPENQCFHYEKDFDFPHRRAALMVLGRELFF